MIDDLGRSDSTFSFARRAQGVRCQEHSPCLPPARAVAPGSGAAASFIALFPGLSLVLGTISRHFQ